jgi:hypothetical protein
MKKVFAPGCALLIHNPDSAEKIKKILESIFGEIETHTTCCHHDPEFAEQTTVINVCAGCDKRYRLLYENTDTVSLWEVLTESDYPFPDYKGREMGILDACPTRNQERVHIALRKLADKMNIKIIEPEHSGKKGKCCGDTFYGKIPTPEVEVKMKERASEMPLEEVIVHCVTCVKSMTIGGKKPRHIVDLILGEETFSGDCDIDRWHDELNDFIKTH